MITATYIKKQSKKMSLLESFVNVLIGYVVAVLANLSVLPLFGYYVTFADSLYIGLAFTFISLCRTYIIRRIFNY